MKDVFVAMLFAAGQVIVTALIISAITHRKRLVVIPLLVIKFYAYASGISKLSKVYAPHIRHCFYGFIAGVPISAFVLLILVAVVKRLYKHILG